MWSMLNKNLKINLWITYDKYRTSVKIIFEKLGQFILKEYCNFYNEPFIRYTNVVKI